MDKLTEGKTATNGRTVEWVDRWSNKQKHDDVKGVRIMQHRGRYVLFSGIPVDPRKQRLN